jgi:alanine dehydrogenase
MAGVGDRPHGGSTPTRATLVYLSRSDLESLGVGMGEIVDAVDAGCAARGRGEVAMPPKLSLPGAGGSFSQAMAAAVPSVGGLGVKWVTIIPDNVGRGLPVVNGLVVVSDPETGLPEAVMDAAPITAWRTGAGVGVAARYLSRREVECVGVLGCGVQARSSVRALAAVLPQLRVVRCHDAVAAVAESFAADLAAEVPKIRFTICSTPVDVPRGAGVVVSAITMTQGVRPPLGAGLVEPGALAVALDYDAAWSSTAMAECERFFCDDKVGVLATKAAGVRLGGIPAEIAGDLGELAAGRVAGRRDASERLFCLSLGIAVEDVVTARLALDRSRALGVGLELPL